MIPEECVVCPGLGVVKEGKQHLVETRPSTLASVNDQEQRGRAGTGATAQLSVQANVACLFALMCCDVHSHTE